MKLDIYFVTKGYIIDMINYILESSIYNLLFGGGGVLIIFITIILGITKKNKGKENGDKNSITYIRGKRFRIEQNRKSIDIAIEKYEKYEFNSREYYKEFINMMRKTSKNDEFIAYNKDDLYFSRIQIIYNNLIELCDEFGIEINKCILEYGIKNKQIINRVIVNYISDNKIVGEVSFSINYDMIPYNIKAKLIKEKDIPIQLIKRYLNRMQKALDIDRIEICFGCINDTENIDSSLVKYVKLVEKERLNRRFSFIQDFLPEITLEIKN